MQNNQQKMEEKWFVARKRYIPATYPLLAFFDWDCAGYFGVKNSGHIINVWDKGDFFAIWEKKKIGGEFADKALEMLLNIKDYKELRQKSTLSGDKVVKLCKEYALSKTRISIDDHIKFLGSLSRHYADVMKDNACYWLFGSAALERKVRSYLGTCTEEQISEIFNTISHSEEESYSQKVDKEFVALVALAREKGITDSLIQEKIAVFSEKYFWFPYEFVGPDIWDVTAVTKKIETELSKATPKKTLGEDARMSVKDIIEKYNLSDELYRFAELWQTLALLQDDRKMFNSLVSYYLNEVIARRLSDDFAISFEQARYLDREALLVLKEDKGKFDEMMKKRLEFLTVDKINAGNISYAGTEARKYVTSLGIQLKDDVAHVKEIKGQVAFKGKVTGRVRVLKTSQVSDFISGDIIVTGMTTPDFAPLMKQASAIITNEGGITCHAAIVSRELRIPCIIGTKIATQVLKDGDMIEVDAEMGIITILNS